MTQPAARETPPTSGPPARRRPRFRFRPPAAGGRYTRFVALMRVLLPVFAGVLVLLVVIWPQLGEDAQRFRLEPGQASLQEGSDQQAVNARFTGLDQQRRPYTLTAQSARQAQAAPDEVALALPKADITLSNGAWIALSAEKGLFHRRSQALDLDGDVTLFHDNGFELRTSAARIDFTDSAAVGDRPVHGQGPLGTLDAEGFQLFDGGKRILFDGPSRLVFWPQARERDK